MYVLRNLCGGSESAERFAACPPPGFARLLLYLRKALDQLTLADMVARIDPTLHSQQRAWCVHRSEIKEETAKRAGDIRGGGRATSVAGSANDSRALTLKAN
jgi:hypothetical protein